MSSPLTFLVTLTKAIKAEERNGCTNAGVMGGFAEFMAVVLHKLAAHSAAEQASNKLVLERFAELAQNYLALTPRQRQKMLSEIAEVVGLLHQIFDAMPDRSGSPEYAMTDSMTGITGMNAEVSHPLPATAVLTQQKLAQPKLEPKVKPVVAGEVSTRHGVPIQYLKSVGPQRAKLLQRIGIHSIEDLLNHFPRRYEDRRDVKHISQVQTGEVETVRGTVISQQELAPRRGLKISKLTLSDGTASLQATWFNNPYVIKQLPRGVEVLVTGKVDRRFGTTELSVTDYELIDADFAPKIIPVYAGTESLTSKQMRTLIASALNQVEELMPEVLPQEVLVRHQLMGRAEAYRQIHFPTDFTLQAEARRRLVFEEFVLLQLGIQTVHAAHTRQAGIVMQGDNSLVSQFRQGLPYTLTGAQERVIGEILHDMAEPFPMARLVQGDVGSGKTVVAAVA
ncbi:MAG: OB-fold nucleic acid binding domain-containing protein, partial [Peptococcaceae bacterium]|nr:OB-fold nucleic acid binding domain-containing protein [Peptococcaceae bacterium]